jgi:hypothetical protein
MTDDRAPVTVRLLAFLHTHQRELGRPTSLTLEVPAAGVRALDIATSLELPVEIIEGLFLNGTLLGLGALVRPGDRVAFVPYGTPASHPAFFHRTGIRATAVA